MPFLSNPHFDLTTSRIETERCVLIPFSTDGRVDIRELQQEFCKANKDLYVWPHLPNYAEEIRFVEEVMRDIEAKQTFELFILEKWTNRFIGCAGLNHGETDTMNIGLWIRVDEHGKWYATEAYKAIIDWARTHTKYLYLKHCLDPRNDASRKLALKFGGILQEEKSDRGHEIYHIPL